MSRYNCLKKIYPDGTVQYKLYDYFIHVGESTRSAVAGSGAERQITIEDYQLNKLLKKRDSSTKDKENRARAIQKVYDYAKSNDFMWFCTFTVNPKICDSFNYIETLKELKKFRKYLTVHGLQYIIVPEQHESGRWHFHGLISEGLKVEQAFDQTGKELKGIFHVKDYKLGFTTATKIKSKERTNTYITKYISKALTVPKGYKRYWTSQGLATPKEVASEVKVNSEEYFNILHNNNDYFKRVDNEYGTLFICEKQARS